eukprot:151068-Rhodomonas_salina.4
MFRSKHCNTSFNPGRTRNSYPGYPGIVPGPPRLLLRVPARAGLLRESLIRVPSPARARRRAPQGFSGFPLRGIPTGTANPPE